MTAKTIPTWLAALLLATSAGAGAAEPGHAGPSKDEAHHHDHEAGAATLVLNDGAKWQTDDVLKAHMAAFREKMAEAIPAIHAGGFDDAQYAALAGALEKELYAIMNRCKLEPAVDAQFHLLLAELFAGIEAMKKEGDRMQGAVRVVRGLDTYQKHFEHPGWKPLQHGHGEAR